MRRLWEEGRANSLGPTGQPGGGQETGARGAGSTGARASWAPGRLTAGPYCGLHAVPTEF